MPKLKTKSGAKKRFRKAGGEGYKYYSSGRRHNLTKQTTKRKRHSRKIGRIDKSDALSVERMLRGS